MIIPVILSGGSGSRLWPLSRQAYSKQFLSLNSEQSLLQQTSIRVQNASTFTKPLIVCGSEHQFLIEDQLENIGIIPMNIILEPTAKNTAPAIALAAFYAHMTGQGQELLLILPSDHSITNIDYFTKIINKGAKVAHEGKLVTFGIVPTKPETGYGYIHKTTTKIHDAFQVSEFVEKPSIEKAKSYIESGDYFWNAGIFLFKADVFLQELEKYAPQIYQFCKASMKSIQDDNITVPQADIFSQTPANSIDYAVMEKSDKVAVIPFNSHWNDIGSFAALWEELPHDVHGNATQGDSYLFKTEGCYTYSESTIITTVGVKDLIIVQTKDAVLVADKHQAQDVKHIVDYLKKEGREETTFHKKVYRPWGTFEGIAQGDGYQVKTIIVKPGEKLSLQNHQHRCEHWICVTGTVTVTRGSDIFDLNANQSTYIPIGELHSLENNTQTPSMIVEVQTGDYLGEDDIVRYDDIYGRESKGAEQDLPMNMHASHFKGEHGKFKKIMPNKLFTYLKSLPFGYTLAYIKRQIMYKFNYTFWKLNKCIGAVPHLYKVEVLRELSHKYKLPIFIETGTEYGEITAALVHNFNRITTIELSDELYTKSHKRFKENSNVTCIRGDSADRLISIINGLNRPALIFLDAYYSGGITGRGTLETPLKTELEIIINSKKDCVIVINNARCLTGTNDYPTLEELKNICAGFKVVLRHDLLIITKNLK